MTRMRRMKGRMMEEGGGGAGRGGGGREGGRKRRRRDEENAEDDEGEERPLPPPLAGLLEAGSKPLGGGRVGLSRASFRPLGGLLGFSRKPSGHFWGLLGAYWDPPGAFLGRVALRVAEQSRREVSFGDCKPLGAVAEPRDRQKTTWDEKPALGKGSGDLRGSTLRTTITTSDV